MNGDVRPPAGVRELGILRQEAVPGMDRVGPGDLGRRDQARDPQVGEPPGGRPDADVVVGEPDVERFPVRLGVDRHRLEPELAAGADDPQGDLAPVGNEHLPEHRLSPGRCRWRSPGTWDVMAWSEVEWIPEARRANSLGLVE